MATKSTRVVDYFYVAGISSDADLASRKTNASYTPPSSARPSLTKNPLQADSPSTRRRGTLTPSHLQLLSPTEQARLANNDSGMPPQTPRTPVNPDKKPHPLDFGYQAELLLRYPEHDWSDPERFPAFTPMFCFPNDLRFGYDNGLRPPETYHSFVITQETGARLYGVCLTLYEKLSPELTRQLEILVAAWRLENIVTSDVEYVKHIQKQLDQATATLKTLRESDPTKKDQDVQETIFDLEDKVTLYVDLLAPLRRNVLFDANGAYMPRCVGLMSHWPWHDLLKDWLTEVVYCLRDQNTISEDATRNRYKNVVSKLRVPLERYLVNLIHEIPLPPPGKLEVSISVGRFHLYCSRPPANTISVIQNFSIYPIFRTLSIPHVVSLFELVLAERKIILLSSHLVMLTLAAETLSVLVYPFAWQHIYIPILPARLLSYLQAPMPYIVGVQREYFDATGPDAPPSDVAIVDLDNDVVTVEDYPTMLPTHERKKLLTRLHKYSGATGLLTVNVALGGSSGSLSSRRPRGVPYTSLRAFPDGRTCPNTADSYKRVINDYTESYQKPQPAVPGPKTLARALTPLQMGSSLNSKNSGSSGALNTMTTATPSPAAASILGKLRSLATSVSMSSLARGESQESMDSMEFDQATPSSGMSRTSSFGPGIPPASRPPPMPAPGREPLSNLQSPGRSLAWGFIPSREVSVSGSPTSGSPERKSSATGQTGRPSPLGDFPTSSDTKVSIEVEAPSTVDILNGSPERGHQRFSSEISGRPGLVRGTGHRRQVSEGSSRSWLASMMPQSLSPSSPQATSSNPSLTGSSIVRDPETSSVESADSSTSKYFKSFFQRRPPSALMNEDSFVSTSSSENPAHPELSTSASTHSMSSASSHQDQNTADHLPTDAILLSATSNTAKFSPGHHRTHSLQVTVPSSSNANDHQRQHHHHHSPHQMSEGAASPKSPDRERPPFERRRNSSGMSPLGPRPVPDLLSASSRRQSSTPEPPATSGMGDVVSPMVGSPESTQSVASWGSPGKGGGVAGVLHRLSQSSERESPVTPVGPVAMPQSKRKEGHVFWEVNVSELVRDVAVDDGDGEYAKPSVARENLEVTQDGAMLCRVCQVDLRTDEAGKALKCELCYMKCHMTCFGLAECRPCPTLFNERKVRNAFLKVFTSLLKSYRSCLTVPDSVKNIIEASPVQQSGTKASTSLPRGISGGSLVDTQGLDLTMEEWFKKEDFLAAVERETKTFMTMLVDTQAFAQFTLDRIERPETDHEILFFDECIKAKLNRSQLRIKKEATPFLTDPTYAITQTFAALAPSIEDIDSDAKLVIQAFPSKLDSRYLTAPRIVQPLITASDQKMMRSHTAGIVQRARMIANTKRKQDFSKWMRTRWKMFQQIGNGEVVSLGFLSDEQRRELLDDRLKQVAIVIEKCEAAHLSSQRPQDVRRALRDLYAQNDVLMRATDEEQLVESGDQQEMQLTLARLFRVITIYEEFASTLPPEVVEPETPSDNIANYQRRPSIVDGFTEEVLSAVGMRVAEGLRKEMQLKKPRASKPLPAIPTEEVPEPVEMSSPTHDGILPIEEIPETNSLGVDTSPIRSPSTDDHSMSPTSDESPKIESEMQDTSRSID
ncbi:hypothetical protein SmJEL517_g03709 [Synchytrium microbalum]|uniref:UDENN domain-containing protein n=1 Tax=Synchytrium microbalum TaxID=1806994 RepID=A0A507C5K2_9FUNG|nr:uncharacterized protein SmJEL517_g03709 [Synchytrium microbalum]TPX33374.1 hypothetical protein SmJEL517_g03709 [Synchytrium microbalum]